MLVVGSGLPLCSSHFAEENIKYDMNLCAVVQWVEPPLVKTSWKQREKTKEMMEKSILAEDCEKSRCVNLVDTEIEECSDTRRTRW